MQIYLKGENSVNSPRAVLLTLDTKGCVVIWKVPRSTLIRLHHQIMNSHVSYVAMIYIQHVAFGRGHQFTSFFRKGVRRARPVLLRTTVSIFWSIL